MTANKRPSKREKRKDNPPGLWSRGMIGTLGSQSLSAVGDNALLFAALALVRKGGYPAWSGPLLQSFFVGTYILLAPFVGVFADSQPKGRVMLFANILKFVGAFGMCVDVNPFLCYALVGAGAAANSPAKYGILSELAPPGNLVKANSLLEASVIAGILLGSIAGGALTDWSIEGALVAITACYAAAAASALLIPRLRRVLAVAGFSPIASVKTFASQISSLLTSPDARLSLIGTAVFWGAGAALRFLIIAWVPIALKVTNNRLPAFLTATLAAGIVVGAILAARFVRLEAVHRALPAGVLIGVGVCLVPLVKTLPLAFTLMVFVGMFSGFFVVPLDVLLQRKRGDGVAVGSAIAIQNFFENLSMLVLVSAYTAVAFIHVPVNDTAFGLGIVIALTMGALTVTRSRSRKTAHR